MLRLLLFIALFIGADTVAQDCKTYVNVVTDEFGEKTPTAKKNILVVDEKNIGFDITALTTQNTVVLVVGVMGGFQCVGKGDFLEVSFRDESTLTLINNYNENCFGRTAAYLGPDQRNLGLLTQLSTKLIASLKVWTKATSTTMSFDESQAGALRETLQCLASYLKTKNYQGDSIAEYTRPVYKPDTTRVVNFAEVPPEFEGGYTALMTFIARNMRYPAGALRDGVSGIVYLSFIVNEDGLIQDPKVLRPLHPALDAEALRVISVMPKWKPGIDKGKPVKARFNLPVKFSMVMKSDSEKKKN
jgi:TonB family protein